MDKIYREKIKFLKATNQDKAKNHANVLVVTEEKVDFHRRHEKSIPCYAEFNI